jgi:hypothetical protein
MFQMNSRKISAYYDVSIRLREYVELRGVRLKKKNKELLKFSDIGNPGLSLS